MFTFIFFHIYTYIERGRVISFSLISTMFDSSCNSFLKDFTITLQGAKAW